MNPLCPHTLNSLIINHLASSFSSTEFCEFGTRMNLKDL